MVLVRTLVSDAEVELLHALDLVADILELAYGAIGGKTLHDVSKSAGDGVGLLCIFMQRLEIDAGIGDENDGDIQNVGILFVRLDVAVADRLEIDASFDGLFGNADLLAVALGRHTHHVALGVNMIFAEFDILQRTVDLLVLALENADAEKNDACEGYVLPDLLEIGAVKYC